MDSEPSGVAPQSIDRTQVRENMQKLAFEMPRYGWKSRVNARLENRGFKLSLKEKKLRDALKIDKLKDELDSVRASGDETAISVKERAFTDKIQKEVSAFPYKEKTYDALDILTENRRNCLGASMLGGGLLSELGLTYLVGDVPGHSVLLLITKDGRVEWRDMLIPPDEKRIATGFETSPNTFLTDDTIRGNTSDGSPLKVSDIVTLSQTSDTTGLSFRVRSSDLRASVTVFNPEPGIHMQLLNNIGHSLAEKGDHVGAINAFKQGLQINGSYGALQLSMGRSLQALGRTNEAIETLQNFLRLASEQVLPFSWKNDAEDRIKAMQTPPQSSAEE